MFLAFLVHFVCFYVISWGEIRHSTNISCVTRVLAQEINLSISGSKLVYSFNTSVSWLPWIWTVKIPLRFFKLLERRKTFLDFKHLDVECGSILLANKKLSSSITLFKETSLALSLVHIRKYSSTIVIHITFDLQIICVLIKT